ncbi:MAG TPA: S-methyl-5-thioribose-1-phosphate isomerase, partial [Thermoplasmata archaeon]|nr:S-methyl-5-thioribose-1-phosphate isomerase [Thermoplasmata archaeon]
MRVLMDGVPRQMRTLWWKAGGVVEMIDQRELPGKLRILQVRDLRGMENAIREMAVRGAPAIGAAAAYGMVLGQRGDVTANAAAERLRSTRPTGRDLGFAIDHMKRAWEEGQDLLTAAQQYNDRLAEECAGIGRAGSRLISDGSRILTHCNAGALATVDHGTALAPVREAHRAGMQMLVYADETRPWLQGSRLTAWELLNEGIDHRIIADSAGGWLMRRGEVDLVVTGADRIARNGDSANKIGTYEKAVLAKENGIPFYVAAPFSTFDLGLKSGDGIVIEDRSEAELLEFGGVRVAPAGSRAKNPVFDVTPAKYIKGIITEFGILP